MIIFRFLTGTLLVCTCAWAVAEAQSHTEVLPSAESIMAKVAANQDQGEAERGHYVYVQHARMVSRHGKTVECEEVTNYRITPTNDGSEEQLLDVDGRYLKNHKYVTVTKL